MARTQTVKLLTVDGVNRQDDDEETADAGGHCLLCH